MSKEDPNDVVVDLNSSDKSSKNLSDEEQKSLDKLSDDLRKELGMEDKNTLGTKSTRKGANSYESFMKQFGKKTEKETVSSSGKYDSDLDFKLNRKIRRVYLPLPKKAKIAIISVASGLAVVFATLLGVLLYKSQEPVTLSSIALSQPAVEETVSGKILTYYYVQDAHVGDTLTYDNIYLQCEYSDGNKVLVPVSASMAKVVSSNKVQNGKFSSAGNCDVEISYLGNQLTLRYIVSYNMPSQMTLFLANANNNVVEISETMTSIDLSDMLRVNIEYDDQTIKNISLDKCKFFIAGDTELSCTNGVLTFPEQTKDTILQVRVEYSETAESTEYSCSSNFSLKFVE